MAINRNDDYDKLAKILYPSIEASGNVYYGQTRKLTMDEILGKNDLNFESHIETFNNGDQTYKSYFMWKIGPLHGSIQLNCNSLISNNSVSLDVFGNVDSFEYIGDEETKETGPNYTRSIFFAKYSILIDAVTQEELIGSGAYNVYCNNASAVFDSVCYTSGMSPVDPSEYADLDRNFYIDYANKVIYVKIIGFKKPDLSAIEIPESEINKPLTLSGGGYGMRFRIRATLHDDTTEYSTYAYRIDGGGGWIDFVIKEEVDTPPNKYIVFGSNTDGDYVTVLPMQEVEVICKSRVSFNNGTNEPDAQHIQFEFEDDTPIYASGNVNSLIGDNFSEIDTVENYEFYKLFFECTQLNSAPVLPATKLGTHCYDSMFSGTSITTPPELPSEELANDCYSNMFGGCTSLVRTPTLLARHLKKFCYASMFDSCTALNEIRCYAVSFKNDSTDDWLIDAEYESRPGTLYIDPTAIWQLDSDSGIPSGWKNVNRVYYFNVKRSECSVEYKRGMLSTSGSDSEINGRGVLNDTTLFNMLEKNPLYNGSVKFDEYNKDGSFNEEIWGCKCFNSPVMFRNGIYGECASLTTLGEEPQFSFSIENTATGDKDTLQSYGIGSTLSCRKTNSYTDDTGEYKPYAYNELSVIHSELDDKHALYDGGITHFTAQYKCGTSINETMYAGIQSYVHHYRNAFLQYQGAVPDYTYYNHMVNQICAGNVLITLNDLCNITYGETHEDSYIEVNSQVIPNQNDTINLGSLAKRYLNTYSKYVNATTVNAATVTTDQILGTSNNQLRIGSSTNKVYNITSSNINCNSLTGTYTEGVALALLPETTGSMKVGSIALVILDSQSYGFTQTLHAGSRIKRGSSIIEDNVTTVFGVSDLQIYFAEIDNIGNIKQGNIVSIDENDTFALLSQIGSYNQGGTALIMRIA